MIQPRLDELQGTPDISITTLKDFCSWALEKWRDAPDQPALREKALCSGREAAEIIAGLAEARRNPADREMAVELAQIFRRSGIHDGRRSSPDIARAQELRNKGWSGLVASMVLAPAWSLSHPLSYDAVPRWLWAEYTRYLFTPPRNGWSSDFANSYAANLTRSLEMVTQLARANKGSSAVKETLAAYFEQNGTEFLAAASIPLSQCLALRGKFSDSENRAVPGEEPLVLGRSERALRLGLCFPRISDTSAARSLLALAKHLPADKFDVQYFVSEYTYGRLEEGLRSASASITLLDSVFPQQSLEMASLDAALLLIDPLEPATPLTQLGFSRFAPLQMATNLRGTQTFLPEIDLFVGALGSEGAPQGERIGVLPLPAMVCHVDEPPGEPSCIHTRASLGIPPAAKVVASIVPCKSVSFEMIGAWSSILLREPRAHLLLHLFNEDGRDDEGVHRDCVEIDRELVARGIATERLTVLGARQPLFEDWVGLMDLSDVHLDSYPTSTPLAVAASLGAGVPTVCWTGDEARMRPGARMLIAEDLASFVTATAEQTVDLVCSLLSDDAQRASLRGTLSEALMRGMPTRDTLAASDAFGALLISAYDQVHRTSCKEFREERESFSTPVHIEAGPAIEKAKEMISGGQPKGARARMELVLGVEPLRLDARRVMGQALAHCDNHSRSVLYQAVVLRKEPKDAQGWFELSQCHLRNSSFPAACSALDKSIKLDSKRPDLWFLLGDMTLSAGDVAGARSVVEVLRRLAPGDSRLAALEGRILAHSASVPGIQAAPCGSARHEPEAQLMGAGARSEDIFSGL